MAHSATQHSQATISKHIRRASWLMVASILLSRVIGFAREWVLAHALGASAETDVYLASFTLPDLLNFLMAAGTMSLSLIPLIAEYRARDEEALGHRVYSALLTWFGVALIGLIVLGEVFAESLAQWIAPGFSSEQKVLLAQLLRIIFPAQLFFFVGSLGIAVQQCYGRFLFPALAPIVYNSAIVIGGVFLHRSHGVAGFSIGVLAGSFLSHAVLQSWGAYRLGYRWRWVGFSDGRVRAEVARYVYLTTPLVVGLSVVVADEWFGKYIASQLQTKSLSWLSYARIQMRIPVAILGQAAGVASFPFLARLWSSGEVPGFTKTLWSEIHKLLWLAPLATLFLYQFSEPFTYFLYGGGRFTAADLEATAELTRWMSLGVCFWTIQVLLVRGLYAAKDTWRPSIAGLIVSALSFPIYWWLGFQYGHNGLAVAGVAGVGLYSIVLVGLLIQQVAHATPGFVGRVLVGAGVISRLKSIVFWGVVVGFFAGLGIWVRSWGIFQGTRLSGLFEILAAFALWAFAFLLLNHLHFRKSRLGSLL
jgi:putative peptidoglycan lipid II flippase